jgi:hypothetical protein
LGTGTLLDFLFTNRKRKPIPGPYAQGPSQGAGQGYTVPAITSQDKNRVNDDIIIPKDDNK